MPQCSQCLNSKTTKRPNGTEIWRFWNDQQVCHRCHQKLYHQNRREQRNSTRRELYGANTNGVRDQARARMAKNYTKQLIKECPRGICWQGHLRRENLLEDLSRIGRREPPSINLSDIIINTYKQSPFTFTEVCNFIRRHEWLGSMPQSIKRIYVAYHGEWLLGVLVFTVPYTPSGIIGPEYKDREWLLARGASISWAPANLATFFIAHVMRDLAKTSDVKVVTAYSDPLANEIGTIYQAANFTYLGGHYGGDRMFFIRGRWRTRRWIRKFVNIKRYALQFGYEWRVEWNTKTTIHWEKLPAELRENIKAEIHRIETTSRSKKSPPKHKYAYAIGRDKYEHRELNSKLRLLRVPYPKREKLSTDHAVSTTDTKKPRVVREKRNTTQILHPHMWDHIKEEI